MATVAEVIDQLSAAGSTWTRADVLRAICDLQPALPRCRDTDGRPPWNGQASR